MTRHPPAVPWSDTRCLRTHCFAFLAVYALYNLSYFYKVDLAHYAGHPSFEYRPNGAFALEPFRALGQSPPFLAAVQYLFALGCLLVLFDRAVRYSSR